MDKIEILAAGSYYKHKDDFHTSMFPAVKTDGYSPGEKNRDDMYRVIHT